MIKTIYMIFFVCAFSMGLWACAGKQKVEYKNLSSAQFEELIKNENVQLLDVRTLAEHMEGHIPGSLNINVQDKDFSSCIDDLLDNKKEVAYKDQINVMCAIYPESYVEKPTKDIKTTEKKEKKTDEK